MQGSIHQLLSLVMHGNAALQGRDIGGFWPHSMAFFGCEAVTFLDPDARGLFGRRRRIVAADPAAWLAGLHGRATGLRVRTAPGDMDVADWMTVGFANGGGRWLIEVAESDGSDLWEASWRTTPARRDNRIWLVDYHRIATRWAAPLPETRDPETMRADLVETLTGIAAFARKHRTGFDDFFANGLTVLDTARPLDPVRRERDMAPPGFLSPVAERLLAVSQAAWVFGGMGSWNDMGFSGADGEDYDHWTGRLYDGLHEALIAAANSTFAPHGSA